MSLVFELAQVTADERAHVVEKVIDYAWDGPVNIAHVGDSLFVDLGPLGGDRCQLEQATGRRVREVGNGIGLRWENIHDPDIEN